MQTLRKNSPHRQTVLDNAKDIMVYNLENYFNGKPCAAIPEMYHGDKITIDERGHARLRVHSNLWYEFRVGA
jgi:hypothetical protein